MTSTESTSSAAPVTSSDTSSEVSAEAEATETEGTEKAEAKPAAPVPNKKKFQLKVDGEEIEEELDLNDDEGLKNKLQLARAAKKRMNEAVSTKRQAMEIIKAFEQDPESMLRRLGPKGREIAEKFLLGHIQEELMSPEEKERRDMKKKLETYEQKEAREKEEREAAANAKREADYANSFQQTIMTALQKSGLPKTPELVKRMAAIMSKNLEFGLELTPDDLVNEVKTDLTAIVKSIVGDSDGDSLISLFGNDVANKIRKSDLKRLQEKQSQVFQGPKKTSGRGSGPVTPDKGYETPEEFRERIRKNLQN